MTIFKHGVINCILLSFSGICFYLTLLSFLLFLCSWEIHRATVQMCSLVCRRGKKENNFNCSHAALKFTGVVPCDDRERGSSLSLLVPHIMRHFYCLLFKTKDTKTTYNNRHKTKNKSRSIFIIRSFIFWCLKDRIVWDR